MASTAQPQPPVGILPTHLASMAVGEAIGALGTLLNHIMHLGVTRETPALAHALCEIAEEILRYLCDADLLPSTTDPHLFLSIRTDALRQRRMLLTQSAVMHQQTAQITNQEHALAAADRERHELELTVLAQTATIQRQAILLRSQARVMAGTHHQVAALTRELDSYQSTVTTLADYERDIIEQFVSKLALTGRPSSSTSSGGRTPIDTVGPRGTEEADNLQAVVGRGVV